MNKNGEGYVDPTPGAAFGNIRREEHKREADRLSVISNLIPIMKNTAELAGFAIYVRKTVWRCKMFTKCQKCGKKLTDPESMARGYGPECWSQITGEPPDSNAKVGDEDEISGQMNIFDFPEYLPDTGEVNSNG